MIQVRDDVHAKVVELTRQPLYESVHVVAIELKQAVEVSSQYASSI